MKKLLILTTLFLLPAACNPKKLESINPCPGNYNHQISVSSRQLCAQIVSTAKDEAQGLSGRFSMREDEGMVFIFDPATTPSFWMKDMEFDLDLIWIKDNKIIDITKNTPAPRSVTENQEENLATYSPPSIVDHVLEVNAGWADKNKINLGDSINF